VFWKKQNQLSVTDIQIHYVKFWLKYDLSMRSQDILVVVVRYVALLMFSTNFLRQFYLYVQTLCLSYLKIIVKRFMNALSQTQRLML
jgi:hypothetical protein